jgi:hypothetical protein
MTEKIRVFFFSLITLLCGPLPLIAAGPDTQPTTRPAYLPVDVQKTIEYLASDALEGRRAGTHGADLAANFIRGTFAQLHLRPLPGLNGYYQPFSLTTSIGLGGGCSLACGDEKYELGKDYAVSSVSSEGAFDAPVVFVGYGVSDAEKQYDDYAGVDVKGKVVLALRFEPENDQGESRFSDNGWSPDVSLVRKARLAIAHGAVAFILVNPPNHHLDDLLMPYSLAPGATVESVGIPFLQVHQSVADGWLKEAGLPNLKSLQGRIDESVKPDSLELPRVRIAGKVAIDRNVHTVNNVLGLLPGKGPHADQYILIGAHYDHLGHGGQGSLAPWSHAIFPGADDNASGTAAMLKLAEEFSHRPPPDRSIIFAGWVAEEEGLIGSEYFVTHSPINLGKLVAIMNLDMVGRVRNQTLYTGGEGTAPEWQKILDDADEDSPLQLRSIGKGGLGPSDHMSFALKKIPVLFLFSGLHMDYHRPGDKAYKINYLGVREVVELAQRIVIAMEDMPKEQYVSTYDSSGMSLGAPAESKVMLGVVPDYSPKSAAIKGVRITGTTAGSPAAKAGLKAGDIVVRYNGEPVDTLMQLADELAKGAPGEKITLGILRDNIPLEIHAVLAARKG